MVLRAFPHRDGVASVVRLDLPVPTLADTAVFHDQHAQLAAVHPQITS